VSAADRARDELLRGVSRSFFLTLRVLPRAIKPPISIGYLLARISDSIADATDLPAPVRLENLSRFHAAVASGESFALAPELLRSSELTPGEIELLESIDGIFEVYVALPPSDRESISALLDRIIEGQTLDVARFPSVNEPRALSATADLEQYTYLVAGSVGEFWNDLCHRAGLLRSDPAAARDDARQFGKGLQLINILRDAPRDLAAGRSYFPADELAQLGLSAQQVVKEPSSLQPIWDRWAARAQDYLAAGGRYVDAMASIRLRFACAVPWKLGEATLAKMRLRSPLREASRVKVDRTELRKILAASAILAMFPAARNGTVRS
jgi:farnesyl-diphosphate farnesyltransferase